MRASEIPGILAYMGEAKRALRSDMYLACVLICGALSELVLREMASDHKTRIKQIIDMLHKSGAITEEQRRSFHTIRRIRNKYVHLDYRENWVKPPEGIAFERDGIITFLEEALAEQASIDNEIFLKHWAHSAMDANEIYRLTSTTILGITDILPEGYLLK